MWKGATNVLLVKLVCWFFGYNKIPRDDDDKVAEMIEEFMNRETDDRGFAKRSTPACEYIDGNMTKEE